MNETTIYIAGPMTGIKDYNRPAFNAAAEELRADGWAVLNPAETDLGPTAIWQDYMRVGITQVCQSQAVALLPGWENSQGAVLESHVADRLGLTVKLLAEWCPPLDNQEQTA